MANRFVIRLHQVTGELIAHITIDTSLDQAQVQQQLTDLAMQMDATREEGS